MTLAASYFSVINVSLRWPSAAQAQEARVTKPLEHSLTLGTELMESEAGGKEKKGEEQK